MGIDEYRVCIDNIDREIVQLFTARMDAAEQIGIYKKQGGIPLENVGRENAVLEKVSSNAPEKYKESVKELYKAIFRISKTYQSKVMEGGCDE